MKLEDSAAGCSVCVHSCCAGNLSCCNDPRVACVWVAAGRSKGVVIAGLWRDVGALHCVVVAVASWRPAWTALVQGLQQERAILYATLGRHLVTYGSSWSLRPQ